MKTMKPNPFRTLTAGLAVMLVARAFAIEAPADNTPPPRAEAHPAAEARPHAQVPAADTAKPAADKAKPATDAAKPAADVAKPAFLGVVSSELPAMLAEHLDLKPGEGILVRALMPDGPAAKAGVVVHDIITRVADQPVGSSQELTKQVATHAPGATIHLDLIHQGKPAGMDVTLGTRPEGIAALDPHPRDPLNLDGIPKDLADRVRQAIEGNQGGIEMNIEDGALEIAPKMQDAMREMKKRLEKAMQGLNVPAPPGTPGINVQQGATIRLMDGQGSIELKTNDGGKEVTIRDKDNKVVWNGPWDTDQDKAAAPDDIRQRVDRLNLDTQFQGNGLRLHLGGVAPQQDEDPE